MDVFGGRKKGVARGVVGKRRWKYDVIGTYSTINLSPNIETSATLAPGLQPSITAAMASAKREERVNCGESKMRGNQKSILFALTVHNFGRSLVFCHHIRVGDLLLRKLRRKAKGVRTQQSEAAVNHHHGKNRSS